MVITHSSAKTTNLSVSQGICEYFSELVKLFATNEILEDMFKKSKEEIISKFKEKFDEQNRKIDELEGKIAIQANTVDQFVIKRDEQYSRRSSLRIQVFECSDDERTDNVLQWVKVCYKEMNLPFQDENIDCVHRIGRTYTDKNSGKKSIIVKFNFWKSCQQ